MGTAIAILFFLFWAVLSVLVLIPKLEMRIRRRDLCRLVPQWRFFAPTPSMNDYFVVYRDILPNDTCTQWTELRSSGRRWWNAFFYPAKRERKAELDTAMTLARMMPNAKPVALSLSVPYLTILNRVASLERLVRPRYTQFAVATINLGMENPTMQIYLLSGLHGVE